METDFSSLRVWEVTDQETTCSEAGERPLPGVRKCLYMLGEARGLLGFLHEVMKPIQECHPRGPVLSQRLHLLAPSLGGLGFQRMDFKGNTTFHIIATLSQKKRTC